jgi:NNP family nitrate/nitrite transporter-like MFS transporter
LAVAVAKDLKLTKNQIANSNIIATFLVRLVAGQACDRFGPRKTFAGCLLVDAIPTFLSGTAYDASELMALPFFIGILGGSFVLCQVWSTGSFDKNVVGSANAFAAGFGNAGGGITYFLMPANFDSLVSSQHLTPHAAWRGRVRCPRHVHHNCRLGFIVSLPRHPHREVERPPSRRAIESGRPQRHWSCC